MYLCFLLLLDKQIWNTIIDKAMTARNNITFILPSSGFTDISDQTKVADRC